MENQTRIRLAAGCIPLLFTLSAAGQTPAQTAAADNADSTEPVALDAIEVTAQRRVEKLQDVPVAVTALPESQINARGIDDIGDLNALAPGLQISKTPSNTTISQITIRGVSQINPAIYWDPAVGVYIDGIYLGKAQGSIFNLVDPSRIEVLRGPQGTLYGRNTLAGAINIVTRAPSGSFSGSASVEIGNYDAFVQRASVDLPRVGIANIAIGARSEQRDGWVDTTRESSVPALNDRNNHGFRLAADLDFAPSLRGEYRFDFSTVDQTNNFDQLYRLEQTGVFDPSSPLNALYPAVVAFASRQRLENASVDAPSFERSRVQGHSFTLSYDLDDDMQIKSISGFRRLDWNDSLDLDGGPTDLVWTQRFTDYEQFSQDLQLLGNAGRWTYVAGIYYFGDDGHTNNPQRFFGGGAEYDSRYATQTAAWAGYGQVDFRPLDPLTLTAGVRYTREKKELDRVFGVRGDPSDPFFYLIPEGTHAEDTFAATTPMAAIAWRFNERLNVYFRYAEGFKSGGFNGEFSQPPSGDPGEDIPALIALNLAETRRPFDPEHQRSFELGAKSSYLGGRALFNAAVFHNQLKDFQASIFQGTGAAATIIRNVGDATINGLELEFALIPIDGTQIRANYAYLDAEYDDFRDAQGNNVARNRAFVHAPEHSFNVVIDSELLRRGWGALHAVVDYAWTDDFYTYPYQLTPVAFEQVAGDTEVQAHGLLNLRLAFTDIPLGDRGTGELALWCRNALDDDTASNFIDFGPAFGSLTVANFEEPRTFGITGTVRW
ncbi:TonB-dependent receptor [Fontimonas thermophila]|nr:TonB-dependent receptor [Fontimonas thermophila]